MCSGAKPTKFYNIFLKFPSFCRINIEILLLFLFPKSLGGTTDWGGGHGTIKYVRVQYI